MLMIKMKIGMAFFDHFDFEQFILHWRRNAEQMVSKTISKNKSSIRMK